MKQLYHILAMVCIVVTLSVLGLAIYLAAAGRLSEENLQVLGRMLRGTELFDAGEAPGTEPTSRPATQPAAGLEAADDLAADEQAALRTDLLLSRSTEELRYKQRQLESLLNQVKNERALLAAERVKWAEEIEAARKSKDDAGFQRDLKRYTLMEPRQAKAILAEQPEETAARYLAAMKDQAAADIMAQFRSPADVQKLQRLLDLMRKL